MRSSFVCRRFLFTMQWLLFTIRTNFVNNYCELVFVRYHLKGQTNEQKIEEIVISDTIITSPHTGLGLIVIIDEHRVESVGDHVTRLSQEPIYIHN
jgi:hypothetical protein